MFGWATEQIERLAQTVAPPPTDAIGRFVYAAQRQDESGAQESLTEFADPCGTIVQPSKGNVALHLACLYGMERLIHQIMSMPNANIQVADMAGNTPLHYACMSKVNGNLVLSIVQMLVNQFRASVVAKNSSGQTPYDVASINNVRQYLLPLQLQQETQYALDNGGVGLPPGIDLGGLRISNSHRPPPPTGMPSSQPPGGMSAAPPPMGMPSSQSHGSMMPPPPVMGMPSSQPSGNMLTTPQAANAGFQQNDFSTPHPSSTPQSNSVAPQPSSVPPTASSAPASSNAPSHSYARSGHSSLAVGQNKYRPDGFHSSSSDVNLQRKYGHVSTGASNIAPPPSSGDAVGQPPTSGAANPYARGTARSRYLTHDGSAVAPSSGGYGFMPPPIASAAPPNVMTFMPTPGVTQHATHQQQPVQSQQSHPVAAQQTQSFAPPPAQQIQSFAPPPMQQAQAFSPPPIQHTQAFSPPPMQQTQEFTQPPTQNIQSFPPPPTQNTQSFSPPPMQQTQNFAPPASQPISNSQFQPPETGHSQSAATSQPQSSAGTQSFFPPPPISQSVTKSQPDAASTPQPVATSVFGGAPPTNNTDASGAFASEPPAYTKQSSSTSTDSAQDLFSKPSASIPTEVANASANSSSVVENKIAATQETNNIPTSQDAKAAEGTEFEEDDDLQDVPLTQDDKADLPPPPTQENIEQVPQTANDFFSSSGGLPPPPIYSKK